MNNLEEIIKLYLQARKELTENERAVILNLMDRIIRSVHDNPMATADPVKPVMNESSQKMVNFLNERLRKKGMLL